MAPKGRGRGGGGKPKGGKPPKAKQNRKRIGRSLQEERTRSAANMQRVVATVGKSQRAYSTATKEVKGVLQNFLSPISAKGFRWPYNGPVVEDCLTGTATLHETDSISASSGYVGTWGDAGSYITYLFRDPLRQVVSLTRVTAAFTYTAGTATTPYTWAPAANLALQFITVPYLTCPTNGAPHGTPQSQSGSLSYLYCGSTIADPEACYIWAGVGDIIRVTVAGTGTPADKYCVRRLTNPGNCSPKYDDSTGVAVTSLTTFDYSVTKAGYHAPFITTTATTAPTWTYCVSLVVAANQDVMGHRSIPQAQAHATWLVSARINANSILISNQASQLNVEGNVVAQLVTDGTPFYEHTSTKQITASARQYSGKAKNGIYAWLPPIGPDAFTRKPCFAIQDGIVIASRFPLDVQSGYIAIKFNTVAVGSNYPGIDYMTFTSTAIEYATDDLWAETEKSQLPVNDAASLVQITGFAPCFSENPLHMRDIHAFMNRASSFLRGHSRKIGGALSALFPSFAGPISAVADYVQS